MATTKQVQAANRNAGGEEERTGRDLIEAIRRSR